MAIGTMADHLNQSYTSSASVTSDYHLFAAGRTSGVPLGLVVQLHGDGAGEFPSPNAGVLAAYNNVAKAHGMLMLAPRTPDKVGSRTWWENTSSPVWLLALMDYVRSVYSIDATKIWFMGYSGGSEVQSYFLLPDYNNRIGTGGSIMLGGGGAVGMSYGRTPTAAFKTTQRLHWAVGSNDTNDGTGWNAFAAAQGGYNRYVADGFTRSTWQVLQGADHFQSEPLGPQVLADQLALAYPLANAGQDQQVEPWATVTLAGSGPGTWSQISGPAVTLAGTGDVRTFTAPPSMSAQQLEFDFGGDTTVITVAQAKNGIVGAAGAVTPIRLIRRA